MVVTAIAFSGIQDCFDNAVSHTQADYCQGIPQAPMKYHVAGIPNPFEMKGKHKIPPYPVSYIRNRYTGRVSAAGTKENLNHKDHEEF